MKQNLKNNVGIWGTLNCEQWKVHIQLHLCVKEKWLLLTQSCPTVCDPRDCTLPSSSVHGTLLARILGWVAISFSRRSSQPRNGTRSPILQADSLPFESPHLYLNHSSIILKNKEQFSSVAQSCPTLCDSMNLSMLGLTVHNQLPEFTQTLVNQVGDAIQPSHPVILFSSCPQSLPASGSFPMSQLFAWGGQSFEVLASSSVLPMNTQDWSPLGWTGWISLQSKGLSRVFSNTRVQQCQFFSTQLSSQCHSNIHTWPQEKP